MLLAQQHAQRLNIYMTELTKINAHVKTDEDMKSKRQGMLYQNRNTLHNQQAANYHSASNKLLYVYKLPYLSKDEWQFVHFGFNFGLFILHSHICWIFNGETSNDEHINNVSPGWKCTCSHSILHTCAWRYISMKAICICLTPQLFSVQIAVHSNIGDCCWMRNLNAARQNLGDVHDGCRHFLEKVWSNTGIIISL